MRTIATIALSVTMLLAFAAPANAMIVIVCGPAAPAAPSHGILIGGDGHI